MLTSLTIDNFAIVSHLALEFADGMTAFTGETGAGKSIMIDALMLALGDRADTSVIRPDAEKCEINACFQIDKNSEPADWLTAHDIEHEHHEVMLRRVLYKEGRTKSYINGHPFPAQKVKELASQLVDIHGQHQHQSLLKHQTHRQQLDYFSGHTDLLEEVKTLYQQHQSIHQQLLSLSHGTSPTERKSLLEYQIAELNALNIEDGEMDALNQEHQLLHHARKYLEISQHIAMRLKDDDQHNLCEELNQVLHALSALPVDNHNISSAIELLNSALIQCEEGYNEMTHFTERVQLDPERLQEVEDRLSTLHHTARKYHVDANQLSEHTQKLIEELDQLTHQSARRTELEAKLKTIEEQFIAAAETLHTSRVKAAEVLATEITALMNQLGMPKGYIKVVITPLEKMQPHGLDKVEYQVCTNPGLEPNTLAKVASGGELSRISLAIQMITAQHGATPTLLFDEVDVGIGGATAAMVGQMLRNLGERIQLFCVTHQPQVASKAHHHFKVEKHNDDSQTYSKVIQLTDVDKVDEIARMVGGVTITEQTRSHAREMLEKI